MSFIKRNSSTILAVCSSIGVVATTLLAVKATKTTQEKIEKEKVIKKSPTETKKKSVDTSKIKLHFKDEDTVITKTPPPKEKNVYAIISIVVGIIGMLLSILVNPLGLLMAGTGIALGIVSVKIEIKPIGVVGMIVSLLCCIIAAILVI